jgi:hypothetical protein
MNWYPLLTERKKHHTRNETKINKMRTEKICSYAVCSFIKITCNEIAVSCERFVWENTCDWLMNLPWTPTRANNVAMHFSAEPPKQAVSRQDCCRNNCACSKAHSRLRTFWSIQSAVKLKWSWASTSRSDEGVSCILGSRWFDNREGSLSNQGVVERVKLLLVHVGLCWLVVANRNRRSARGFSTLFNCRLSKMTEERKEASSGCWARGAQGG